MPKHTLLAAGAFTLAAIAIPAGAQETTPSGAKHEETVKPVFNHALPNVPGKALLAAEVLFPPGAASASHRHPPTAFVYAYVVSGEIVSAVDDEQPRVYRAGEGWYEAPGAHHRVTRNASKTSPAKLLAVFVADTGQRQLVFPDPK